jgi:hypothetical protein
VNKPSPFPNPRDGGAYTRQSSQVRTSSAKSIHSIRGILQWPGGWLLIALSIALALPASVLAQPALVCDFGVDADVYAKRLERPSGYTLVDSDDWFRDTLLYPVVGSGIGVIDVNNVNLYGNIVGWGVVRSELDVSGIINRNKTFTAGLAPGLPEANIDAIYIRDHFSSAGAEDSTVYPSGSNKNADNMRTWSLGPGGTPQKNDIVEAAGHMRRGADDSLWLFGYATTISADGNSHTDFEFFAANTLFGPGSGTLNGLGPDSSHTAWTHDGSGTVLPGDVIFVVDFENGGTTPMPSVRVWINGDSLAGWEIASPFSFTFTGTFDDGTKSGPFGYAEIDVPPGSFYAVVNTTNQNTLGAPWGHYEGSSATFEDSILHLQMTEMGVNLQALGLTGDETNPCRGLVLGNIFVKTRSSSSFTSELKDFVGPFAFGATVASCEISCPPGQLVECESDIPAAATTVTEFIAQGGTVDNCVSPISISSSDGALTGGPCGGTVTRTYTVADSCGNESICEQVFTVDDTTPPVITCPGDLTFECDAVGSFGSATATDNCDPNPNVTIISRDSTAGACPEEYTLVLTYQATDACGNTAQCQQTITVEDTTPPVITCPSTATFECDAVGSIDPATATDNCDPNPTVAIISRDSTAGACPQEYTLVLTYEATDACGNSSQCQQTITVEDTTPPVISCPGDQTFECDAVGAFGTATATDNCDPNPTVSIISRDSTAGACSQEYTLVLTYEAADACGNSSRCQQTITVEDTTPPVISCPGDHTFECDAVGAFGTATATDNCDPNPTVSIISRDSTAGACPEEYILMLTYRATDACGNIAQCQQTITVEDTTPPVISCPSAATFECDAVGSIDPATATDNCDPNPTVSIISRDSTAGACPEAYTLVLTYQASDCAGNTSQCQQTVTVEDTTPPVMSCPGDLTFECDAVGPFGAATATDNCDPNPSVTAISRDSTAGACPQAYTLVITYQASDACGNSSQCQQTITVEDTTPPVITCPGAATFECDAIGSIDPATATDNCDPNPSVTVISRDSTAGACPEEYTLVLTYQASDACGNTAQCQQTITVEDTTPPVITCPGDLTFECDAVGSFGTATATDNCDPNPTVSIINRDSTTGACPEAYTLVITYRATDACGNSSQCQQTITVEDTTPPVITCPSAATFECDAVGSIDPATATDNCDPNPTVSIINRDSTAGACPEEYTLVLTYQASDCAGNTSQCQQTITVEDTTPPVISCPGGLTFECDAVGSFGSATATDNCDPSPIVGIISRDSTAGACPEEYTLVLTYQASDCAGNTSQCQQTVTVEDTTPPVISCPGDLAFECDAVGSYNGVTATDNCDPDPNVTVISRDSTAGACPQAYTLVLTYQASDCAGNTSQCQQTVTVEDTTPPVISCPGELTVECDAVGSFGSATATDNCDPSPTVGIISRDSTGGACSQAYTLVLTYQAEDACGNSAQCQQTITVTDTEAPGLTCPEDKVVTCDGPLEFDAPTAVDNCDTAPVITVVSTVTEGDTVATRCWVATDACGNVSNECCQTLVKRPIRFYIIDADSIPDVISNATSLGGREKTLCIWADPEQSVTGGVGGFDFVICYDPSALAFLRAVRGPNLHEDWEYFTWRTGIFGGNCSGGCPDGFVRLLGIADLDNGIVPDPATFELHGCIIELTFYVTPDQEFTEQCVPVGFCAYDCGDNVITTKSGDTTFIPDYDFNLNSNGVHYASTYDIEECLAGGGPGKPSAIECIHFIPGSICIIPPPDDRGDLNINGIANEVGDAVLYSNYFIHGSSVWDPVWQDVQIFASDVNNDGITLTIADLVYLIRIITGDERPFPDENNNPKFSPYGTSVKLTTRIDDGSLIVHAQSPVGLGGALLVCRYSELTVGEPQILAGEGLRVKSRSHAGELRVLIYPDLTPGPSGVSAGSHDLIAVPLEGEGTIELTEAQFSDEVGALLATQTARLAPPTSYAVHQNYPNPFNAGTVIRFDLKEASEWTVTVYNVAGQVVRSFEGYNAASQVTVTWDGRDEHGRQVSSGIYFYRVTAGSFSATKKMTLLK